MACTLEAAVVGLNEKEAMRWYQKAVANGYSHKGMGPSSPWAGDSRWLFAVVHRQAEAENDLLKEAS